MQVFLSLMTLAICLATAAGAWALSADEVIRLKQAGVSDETIHKMMEQERAAGQGGTAPRADTGPVVETKDEVIFRAGQNTPEENRRFEERERQKEDRSLEALRGVIIDQRRPAPATGQGQTQGQTQGGK